MASGTAWKRKMGLTGTVETTALIKSLISQNTHRNIQHDRDVLYSCGTDRALVFKW